MFNFLTFILCKIIRCLLNSVDHGTAAYIAAVLDVGHIRTDAVICPPASETGAL